MSEAAMSEEVAGTSSVDVEVRYAETDQMGVVHHSVYVVWFELARTRLCQETGHHYADIEQLGYQLVVTGTGTRHLRPARYGDTVRVEARVERLQSRILRFAYTVRRVASRGRAEADAELLAEGFTEHVWVDASSGRPCRIPEVLRVPFEALRDEVLPNARSASVPSARSGRSAEGRGCLSEASCAGPARSAPDGQTEPKPTSHEPSPHKSKPCT